MGTLSGKIASSGLTPVYVNSAVNASAGKLYQCDTTSAAFTVTLPTGSTGSVLRFVDDAGTWGTHNLTIAPAATQTIQGISGNGSLVCDLSGAYVEMTWDATNSQWCVQTTGFQYGPPATTTLAGVVSVGAQSFAGAKTFTSATTFSGSANRFTNPNSSGGSPVVVLDSDQGATTTNISEPLCIGSNKSGSVQYCLGPTLHAAQSSGDYYIRFIDGNGAAVRGSVQANSSTTVAFNTSSDARLKTDVVPMTDALARLGLVKPVTYKWREDGSTGEGFIAQDLAPVVPLAVTGEPDGDVKLEPMQVDYSKLVPLLVAAVQELSAKVAALEARK